MGVGDDVQVHREGDAKTIRSLPVRNLHTALPHRASAPGTTQAAMADEEEYVEAFVQGDDSALLAQIKAREAACTPLLKYAWHGTLRAGHIAKLHLGCRFCACAWSPVVLVRS